jgi:hypothetical protein
MSWVKRNLFFVIGGILTLGLLGGAGFYDYQSWDRNSTAFDRLNEIYNKLRELTNQKPSPGNSQINNVEIAREQQQQLRDQIHQMANYFQPIAPIPDPTNGPVSSETFANALHRMIDQLQHDATSASVSLPPQYSFSFEAERSRVKFAPASLNALATQLGEVKVIAQVLFTARVNALDGIQRVRVSDDDASGPASDYMVGNSVTTERVVMTPYVVTFRAFSPEIAQTLAGFAASPHGFIVKSINVQTSEAVAAPEMGTAPQSSEFTSAPGPASVRSGLQSVLQEQLLRATIEVEIVKLLVKD